MQERFQWSAIVAAPACAVQLVRIYRGSSEWQVVGAPIEFCEGKRVYIATVMRSGPSRKSGPHRHLDCTGLRRDLTACFRKRLDQTPLFPALAKVGRLLAVAALRLLQASKVCFKGTGKTGGSLSVNQHCTHKRCRLQSGQSGCAAVAAGHAGDDDVADAAVPAGRVLHVQHCLVDRGVAGLRLRLAAAGFCGVPDHSAGGDVCCAWR